MTKPSRPNWRRNKYVWGHNRRRHPDEYIVNEETGCWDWQRWTDPGGYGRLPYNKNGRGNILAHRAYYERVNGAVPEGLILDHLCRNRRCVNPEHLEPVSYLENANRGLRSHKGRGYLQQRGFVT